MNCAFVAHIFVLRAAAAAAANNYYYYYNINTYIHTILKKLINVCNNNSSKNNKYTCIVLYVDLPKLIAYV